MTTTPAPPTPEREAALRAYADAATDGPWGTHRDLNGTYTIHTRPRITPNGPKSDGEIATLTADGTDAETYANARLMAAARVEVPALLAALDAQRADNQQLRAKVAEQDRVIHSLTGTGSDELHAVLNLLRDAHRTRETHVVADDSEDPEHVDDCPGCAQAAP